MKKTHYHWIFNSSELFGPKKVSSKFRNYYIEMSPVKFSTTLVFRQGTSKFFKLSKNSLHRWKMEKIEKLKCRNEKIVVSENLMGIIFIYLTFHFS